MSGAVLKGIAMVAMFLDHIRWAFFPDIWILSVIGRLAFPIFAYFIAEGYHHTKNLPKYILRMLIIGVITEPFFDLALVLENPFSHQNVMFTFALALLGLYLMDRYPKTEVLFPILFALAAEILKTDYGLYGVLLVFILSMLKERYQKLLMITLFAAVLYVPGGGAFPLNIYYTLGCIASTIPLYFYNDKRGRVPKYLFYVFYPGHLALIVLLRWLIH